MQLLTLSEAAALLERRRGKKVWKKTVKTWGEQGWFQLHWANGYKVNRDEFIQWAARAGRLRRSDATGTLHHRRTQGGRG